MNQQERSGCKTETCDDSQDRRCNGFQMTHLFEATTKAPTEQTGKTDIRQIKTRLTRSPVSNQFFLLTVSTISTIRLQDTVESVILLTSVDAADVKADMKIS